MGLLSAEEVTVALGYSDNGSMGTYTLKQKSLWCGFYLKRNGGNVWCSTDLSEHPTVVGDDGKIETK